MLQVKLFQQLSEQVHQFAYGDSIHMRYIALYTSYDNLLVIAENKYKLTISIESVKWKSDQIIQMKFQTFTLHILTQQGEYIEIILSNLFQKQNENLFTQITLNDCLLPNNIKLKEQYIIKQFSDFVMLNKPRVRIAFISSQGQILFYNKESQIITQIIALRQSLTTFLTIELDNKEIIFGITEFNDLISINENEIEPQIHRFTDTNYSIRQIYFVGNKNILILQENKTEQRFVKYKLTKLKYVKKYYYLPLDDFEYKFVEIHELPKIFIALVFIQNTFKVITLSKKVLQNKIYKQFGFTFKNLIDQNGQQMNFNEIFYCPETCLTDSKEFKGLAIHLSRFNQQFGIKITKQDLKQTLQSDNNILDKQEQTKKIKDVENFCGLLLTSTQIYTIKIVQTDYNNPISFTTLQYLENYQRTFNNIPDINISWQEQLIWNLWHHLNCEQGIKLYFSSKDNISQNILKQVELIQATQDRINIYQFPKQELIYLENQYDKCLTTIALLNLKNLSNEISISKIISMVFNKSYDNSQQIVTENSNIFLQLLQQMKQTNNPVLNYEYWKYSQQLLFILINIIDVWITNLMNKYNIKQIDDQSQFEPNFIKKIKTLIISTNLPIILRMKLIIFLNSSDYIKLFTLGIQKIQDKEELIHFSQVCNINNNFPSLNIQSVLLLINDCDTTYLKNLISISGNFNQQMIYESKYIKSPQFGIIINSILTKNSQENEICKIINWFLE